MAQRLAHNIPQDSLAIGTRKQSIACLVPSARDIQIGNSAVSVVGGDVVHSQNHHYHYERTKDVWAILQSIPNFRKIYQDMLSKATPGTGMWLVKDDKFRLWLEPNGNIMIFWGSGIPAAGKTLLASIVIEHLEALCQASDAKICVCYVFFRYSDRVEVKVHNVLEVLVKQTLERHPDCLSLVEQVYARHLREGTEPTEAQLLGLIRQLTGCMACTFYVLDALDEAPTKIQLAVVKSLASLNVKLFITSRPLKPVEAHFHQAHTFNIVAQDADIDLHITQAINENVELQRLLQADPRLRDEMVCTIKRNCGGMFLHTSLQLDALSECISAYEVRRTLERFPSSIEDVYFQTWDRILKQNADHVSLAKTVLVWVLNASRSITVEELERAVATSPSTHKFEPDRLVPGATLVTLCHGFIMVEEESRLVRLVHYTAKKTLEALLHKTFPHPHVLLAAVCMSHLAEFGFHNMAITSEEEFTAALKGDSLVAYASEAWAFHARAGLDVEIIRRQTAQFVTKSNHFPAFTNSDRSGRFDILTPLHVLCLNRLPLALIPDSFTGYPNVTTSVQQQSPLALACQSGHVDLVAHLIALSGIHVNLLSKSRWSALMAAADQGHEAIVKLVVAHSGIQVNLVDADGWSALMVAARHGHKGVVRLLLEHTETQVNLIDNDGWSALMMAARNGHTAVVVLLLERPDIQVNLVDSDGWSALMLAAYAGQEGAIELLLACPSTHVNQSSNDGWTALIVAARVGQEGATRLLLASPWIKANLVDNDMWPALIWAANEGHEGVVELLLAHGEMSVDLVNNEGRSALMLAARNGHAGVVKLLLVHPDMQVNRVDSKGWSALKLSAHAGYQDIVTLLLAVPVTLVNLVNSDGWSALIVAARYGHEGVANLLLAVTGIQVNLVSKDGWSALMAAARNGHTEVVKLLLAHTEIQVDLVNNEGWSALRMAARFGHTGVVAPMLAYTGTKVNSVDKEGCSALTVAAQIGREGTLKLLLAHSGIQVNLVDKKGWTALMVAAYAGYESIIKLLLEHPDTRVNVVNNDKWSVLMLAAMKGFDGIVKILLGYPGIQVDLADLGGWSALMLAAWHGREGAVKHLLAHPNIQVDLFNDEGWSALMLAAGEGHQGVTKLFLMNADIQVNLVNAEGCCALMIAADRGFKGVVTHLLASPRIQVNLASKHQSTALLAAAENGHEEIVELLLATGTLNVNALDKNGDTAIKLAAARGYAGVVRLLLDAPNVDTVVRSTTDRQTAMSVAQDNGHHDVVELLQTFELRNAAMAGSLNISTLFVHWYDSPDEDGSDSDSSRFYFDAEEDLGGW